LLGWKYSRITGKVLVDGRKKGNKEKMEEYKENGGSQ
jgi:hypothetical protein